MVKYMLYRALRKVPQRPLYHGYYPTSGHTTSCSNSLSAETVNLSTVAAAAELTWQSSGTGDATAVPASDSHLSDSGTGDATAVPASDSHLSDCCLVRQYLYRLFQGRSEAERGRLQDMLYLGSQCWEELHRDFRLKGQLFVRTFEVGRVPAELPSF
jgi:hypothetical protein